MSAIVDVVCTHGFWSHTLGMLLIRRRLEREYGLRVALFNYPSVRGTLDENAAALAQFIRDRRLASAHIIGHSLGGVIALRMLATHETVVPGRLVCMGSPLCGSRAATILGRSNIAEPFLGRTLRSAVIEAAANEWGSHVCAERDVGVIAGNLPYGFGRFVADFDEPNDGTVAVAETRLEGARDHLVMEVSHKGMLVSPAVVDQAAAFLKRGEFLREA